MIDSKRAMWECGYVSGFAADEAARAHDAGRRHRGRALPRVAGRHWAGVQHRDDERCRGSRRRVRAAGRPCAAPRGAARRPLRVGHRRLDVPHRARRRSDLGNTVHCTARDLGDGRVQIDGEKWFCSNVDGEAIALLARPEGATEGSAGLGLYLVPGHLEDGSRNHFTIRRLKDKLGTKSVPTAEVEFHGAIGYALRARSTAKDPAPTRGAQPHDGDGEWLPLRCRDDGARHRAPELPRVGDLGAPPARSGPAPRRPPARARTARRHAVRVGSGGRARVRVRARAVPGRWRSAAPGPRAGGEGTAVPARGGGRERHRRALRRQRLLRGLGNHPPAAGRAVPPDLGGERERVRARCAARDAPRWRGRGRAVAIDDGLAIADADDAPHRIRAASGARATRCVRPAHRRRDRARARRVGGMQRGA